MLFFPYYLGEAVFVDDIPSPKDCLHGAFISSKKALARVKSINFPSSSPCQKVLAFISFKDIPEVAENIGSKTIFGAEPLFADDYTCYAGQPLGFVVLIFFLSLLCIFVVFSSIGSGVFLL